MTRIKKCDKLWAQAVKARAQNKCEVCGKTERLHAHHVIPRTNYSTRYLVENGVCLCYKHHFYWAHKDALDFSYWFRTNRHNDFFLIESERRSSIKNNYNEIEDKLRSYL